MKNSRGLTLIELAVVLIVLGILLGIGAGILGALIKRVKYNESREIVDANVEAVKGFATANGRLPANVSEVQNTFRSLADSYGKPLIYIFSGNLDDSSTSICDELSTNITVRVGCTDSTCSTYDQEVSNVAFLIVSGNGNHNLQTGDTSLTSVSTTPVIIMRADSGITLKIYAYGTPSIDDYTADLNRPEPYDDIVRWVSLHELKELADCPSLSVSITTPLTSVRLRRTPPLIRTFRLREAKTTSGVSFRVGHVI